MPAEAGERCMFGDNILPDIEPLSQAGKHHFWRRRSRVL